MTRIALAILCLAPLALAQPGGRSGDGIWYRNAYFGEIETFDKCLAHQPGSGTYHNHVEPICLRAQLSDNVEAVYSSRTGATYREKAAPWTHSPLLGWAFDGYPIYGPYGYSDPKSAATAIKRLKSSFRLRSITQRTTLADWSLAYHTGLTTQLSSTQAGPDVSTTYPLGRYVEDFEYVAGLGDLDQYNGRFTVTPEFPQGTYAYYVTINDDGSPAFPYILAMQYYGSTTGGGNTGAAGVPVGASDYFANGTQSSVSDTSPVLTSWLTRNAEQQARVISGWDPSLGPQNTWPTSNPAGVNFSGGTTTPVLADTQRVRFTSDTVYVNANGLGSYPMGPWFAQDMPGGVFSNWPSNQNFSFRVPRSTSVASTKTNTGLGAIGVLVNGVAVFNVLDGGSYSNSSRADVGGGNVVLSAIQVSAASLEGGPMAPGSLASAFPLFGAVLATSTASVDSPNWPTTLGGATVSVRDSAGVTRSAVISYASAGQVNYRIPEDTATGLGSVTISAGGANTSGNINVVAAYPNLFKLNESGLAAAQVLRARGSQQTYENVYQTNAAGAIVARAIDLGPDSDQVFLILYASGLGTKSPVVTATIGGVDATLSYGGPQGTFPGLDQINVLIPRPLAGKGSVDVIVAAGGKKSNPVNVTIQ
jgi:uncharacterized protein (TIGR03437 family)